MHTYTRTVETRHPKTHVRACCQWAFNSPLKDAQHLLAALKQDYEAVTVDWTGSLFCGITLTWDYNKQTVDLSMPGYVTSALAEFNFTPSAKPEHQPH
jgi:hypothetical protein